MIIFINKNGEIINQHPAVVNQGSVAVNDIKVVAPLKLTTSATISFELPSGMVIEARPMIGESIGMGDLQNMWVKEFEEDITSQYGTVKFSIRFQDATGDVLFTTIGSFPVNESIVSPTNELDLDDFDFLNLRISQLNAEVDTLQTESNTLEIYDSVLTSTTTNGNYQNYLLTVTVPDTVTEELIDRYGLKVKMPSGFFTKNEGWGFLYNKITILIENASGVIYNDQVNGEYVPIYFFIQWDVLSFKYYRATKYYN